LKNIFLSFFLLFSFTIFSEENESLELLYKKIEVLEEEIRDLRNILEENSILVNGADGGIREVYLILSKNHL